MTVITPQVSLYPLRHESIELRIREAPGVLCEHGLATRMGAMSMPIWGEEPAMFASTSEALHQAAESGDTVAVVMLSNACPSPGKSQSSKGTVLQLARCRPLKRGLRCRSDAGPTSWRKLFWTPRHAIVGVLNRWSVLGLQRRLAGLLRPTVYDAARSCDVAKLKRLLRPAIGGKGHIVWRTSLFSHGCSWMEASLPWRGFLGMMSSHRET